MTELAKVGTFCPNPACPDYEQVQKSCGGNIDGFVKSLIFRNFVS